MKIIQPYHTGFVVSDMGRSVDFYTNVLGMRVERQPAEVSSSWLADVVGYDSVSIVLGMVGVGSGSSIDCSSTTSRTGPQRASGRPKQSGFSPLRHARRQRARMVRTPEGERRTGHRSADPAGCRIPVGPVRGVLPGPGRQLAGVRRACPQAGGLDGVLAGPVHTRITYSFPLDGHSVAGSSAALPFRAPTHRPTGDHKGSPLQDARWGGEQ